jgi:hypothetical protein
MPGVLGDTMMKLRVASATVNDAVPTCPAKTAVMVEVPGDTALASPLADESPMVATRGADEVQVTEAVKFCIVPSANVPIAANGVVTGAGTGAPKGEMLRDISGDDSTVTLSLLLTDPTWAVMVAVPPDCPVAIPVGLTVAIVLSEELQVATLVTFCVVPSLNCPVA